jgi:hypothetical protein
MVFKYEKSVGEGEGLAQFLWRGLQATTTSQELHLSTSLIPTMCIRIRAKNLLLYESLIVYTEVHSISTCCK